MRRHPGIILICESKMSKRKRTPCGFCLFRITTTETATKHVPKSNPAVIARAYGAAGPAAELREVKREKTLYDDMNRMESRFVEWGAGA